jgi:outer membrane immunogenic protein
MRKIAAFSLPQALAGWRGFAADLGAAPIYRKAAPVQVFSWTGGYIGGYVGGAFGANNATTTVRSTRLA